MRPFALACSMLRVFYEPLPLSFQTYLTPKHPTPEFSKSPVVDYNYVRKRLKWVLAGCSFSVESGGHGCDKTVTAVNGPAPPKLKSSAPLRLYLKCFLSAIVLSVDVSRELSPGGKQGDLNTTHLTPPYPVKIRQYYGRILKYHTQATLTLKSTPMISEKPVQEQS